MFCTFTVSVVYKTVRCQPTILLFASVSDPTRPSVVGCPRSCLVKSFNLGWYTQPLEEVQEGAHDLGCQQGVEGLKRLS